MLRLLGSLFLSALLFSLAPRQTTQAAIEYTVKYNAGSSYGGIRFTNEIGTAYSMQTLTSATDFIWRLFQQNNEADRKNVTKVTLFIENMDGPALANIKNNEIHVNAYYLGNFSGDVKREFTGVLYHEMTHIWQWQGNGQASRGLIEGIADFVRLRASYAQSRWVQVGQGDRWDQGYDVTARFLDHCHDLSNGFVAKLNKKMRNGYNDIYFVELLGKSVDQLWTDYKAREDSNEGSYGAAFVCTLLYV